MHLPGSMAWWASVAVLALASVIDIRTRRIPNWLVIPFLASGVAVQWVGGGWSGAGHSLAGVALACAFFGLPCYLGGMGLGDLKLAAGVGAWIGPGQLVTAMVMTAIAGGVLALCYAAWRGKLGASFDKTGDLVARLAHGGAAGQIGIQDRPGLEARPAGPALSIPYAPAIAIGTLFSFFAR